MFIKVLSLSLFFGLSAVSQANTTSGAACSSESISLSRSNPAAERIHLCYSKHIQINDGPEIFEGVVLANSSKTSVVPLGYNDRYFTSGQANALCSLLVPDKKLLGLVLVQSTNPSHINREMVKYFAHVTINSLGKFTGFVFANYTQNQVILQNVQCYPDNK